MIGYVYVIHVLYRITCYMPIEAHTHGLIMIIDIVRMRVPFLYGKHTLLRFSTLSPSYSNYSNPSRGSTTHTYTAIQPKRDHRACVCIVCVRACVCDNQSVCMYVRGGVWGGVRVGARDDMIQYVGHYSAGRGHWSEPSFHLVHQ